MVGLNDGDLRIYVRDGVEAFKCGPSRYCQSSE